MATRQRALEVDREKLAECTTARQISDAVNPRFSKNDLYGKPIRITSVRAKQSDYGKAYPYAVVGFDSEELGPGQFKIGPSYASKYLLELSEDDMPVGPLVLRRVTSRNQHEYDKWDRV